MIRYILLYKGIFAFGGAYMNAVAKYDIEGLDISYDIEGDIVSGSEEVLLKNEHNLIEGLDWESSGYTIAPFPHQDFVTDLKEKLTKSVRLHTLQETKIDIDSPLDYHIAVNDEQHKKITNDLYYEIHFDKLGLDKTILESFVSEQIGQEVTTENPYAPNSWLDKMRMSLRMVRPNQHDNNPFHKDVYIKELKHAVNIYLPLWGSDKNSSLPLIPGSHLWKESDFERSECGSLVNGQRFNVPAIVSSKHPLKAIRPNPSPNEIMIFSPYLIHGGAHNSNDKTRVSLELRFWTKEPKKGIPPVTS